MATQQRQQQQLDAGFWGQLMQFLPLLLILVLSVFNMPGDNATGVGGSKYVSLTASLCVWYSFDAEIQFLLMNTSILIPCKYRSFTVLKTISYKLTPVNDIQYFVSDQFLRTIYRHRYQLSQVERMVERSYKNYLMDECRIQKNYLQKLENMSKSSVDKEVRWV